MLVCPSDKKYCYQLTFHIEMFVEAIFFFCNFFIMFLTLIFLASKRFANSILV